MTGARRRGVDALTVDAGVPGAAVAIVAGGADAYTAAVGVAGVLRGAGVAVVAGVTRCRREGAFTPFAGVLRAGVLVVADDRGAGAVAVGVAGVAPGAGVAVVARGARGRGGDALAFDAGVPRAGVPVVALDFGACALAVGVARVLGGAGVAVVAGVTRRRRVDALTIDAGILGAAAAIVAGGADADA